MSGIRSWSLLLSNRGMTPRWWGAFIAAWAVAAAASRVGIPSVAAEALPTPRPLEQLGAICLCLPSAVLTLLLRDSTDWLLRTSPRRAFAVRLTCNAVIVAVAVAVGALAAHLFPAAVRPTYVVTLFTLIATTSLLFAALVGADYAALIPTALVALSSVAGLVPWQVNIIYNPSAQALHQAMALSVGAVSIPFNAWASGGRARDLLRRRARKVPACPGDHLSPS